MGMNRAAFSQAGRSTSNKRCQVFDLADGFAADVAHVHATKVERELHRRVALLVIVA